MEVAVELGYDYRGLEGIWNLYYIRDVIQNNLCTFCGACIALCNKVEAGDEVAKLKNCNSDCPACVPCPRTELLIDDLDRRIFGRARDSVLGNYIQGYSARSRDPEILKVCQDGGAVTSLLKYLFDSKFVDAALVVGEVGWKPKAIVARTYEEVLKGAGTKYTSCPSLVELARAIREDGFDRIAFVGTPCQIHALRKIQIDPNYRIIGGRVKLLIGIFCMESFFQKGIEEVVGKLNLSFKNIRKFDIEGKYLNLYIKEEPVKIPLEEVKKHTRDACRYCLDFTAEFADISVGSVGSPVGWSTVFTRSEIGDELYSKAVKEGYLESESVNKLEDVIKAAKKKVRENSELILKHIPKIQFLHPRIEKIRNLHYRIYRWRSE